MFCVWGWPLFQHKWEIGGGMSKKKGTWLNQIIQPFSRRSINDITLVQQPATNGFQLLFYQNLYVDLIHYTVFVMH
jgi:hypothetical protein